MARLALAAMLLLALLPTFGRLASAAAPSADWTAVCTMTGLKYVALDTDDGVPAPQPAGGIEQHCAYCPLLAAMAVFALCLALAWPRRNHVAHSSRRRVVAVHRFHPCGLGSRGPPLAL